MNDKFNLPAKLTSPVPMDLDIPKAKPMELPMPNNNKKTSRFSQRLFVTFAKKFY